MILGVVLAGGQSTRFGSDKALAKLNGKTLLEHAIHTLGMSCEKVVVAGRATAPVSTVADWPSPGLGPLGGIAGSMLLAEKNGYSSILTCGVDSFGLPTGILKLLSPAPAFLSSQPVIGHWPTAELKLLCRIFRSETSNSIFAFAEALGARAVKIGVEPHNVNTLSDLKEAERQNGI